MLHRAILSAFVVVLSPLLLLKGLGELGAPDSPRSPASAADLVAARSQELHARGRRAFRAETFGGEAFLGGELRLHEAIAGQALGGAGPGLPPAQVLALGIKVDADALDEELRDELGSGQMDLDDPASTIELLHRDALVGLKGFFDESGRLRSLGAQCALCHATVDDSLRRGIGKRRDGWPNRDLDAGALLALAPELGTLAARLQQDETELRSVLRAWGPGKFDPAFFHDGLAFQPAGLSAAVLVPPLFGLNGVRLRGWTGADDAPCWNAGGEALEDSRPDDERAQAGAVAPWTDRVASELAALQFYQLALPIPSPPEGSFDPVAAFAGGELFRGRAGCARCHVPPHYGEPGEALHAGEEIGIDRFQSSRSASEGYRTAPLRGLFTRGRGGYYHDGRFGTLLEVVEHYDAHFALRLAPREKGDLVEFLKSL